MSTALANSEGWNWKPAMTIQRVAPPTFTPTRSTASRSARKPSQMPHMSPERMKSSETREAASMSATPAAMKVAWRPR